MNRNLFDDDYSSKIIARDKTFPIYIDGENRDLQVYKVPLDLVFYNDQNDRIAAWISKYLNENPKGLSTDENYEEYNNIIERFIKDTDRESLKKTTTNIENFGQLVPAVILRDGRVIDGNRRFTCLRDLNKKEPTKFQYIDALIIDKEIEKDKRQIKLLELFLQHGTEGKVDYDPINRLVGIYRDIVLDQLITKEEYAAYTVMKIADLEKSIELSKLMNEFLAFIKSEGQYHIARDLNIDGPLNEIYAILKKANSDDKNLLKLSLFSMLIMKPENDMTRHVREVKKIVGTEYVKDFIKEQTENSKEFFTTINKLEKVTLDSINDDIRSNEALRDKFSSTLEKYVNKIKIKNAKNKPLELITKASENIENIDTDFFVKMEPKDKQSLREGILTLIDLLNELNEKL